MDSTTDSSSSAGRRDSHGFRFGDFTLDIVNHQLRRDDTQVPLSPKAFRVLTLLVRRTGAIVSKESLLDEVWADTFVLDGVVKVCIADLRKALGEKAAAPRHLHTVPHRGYRFEGPVSEFELERPSHPIVTSACRECGREAPVGAAYCSECGGRLGAVLSQQETSPASYRERRTRVSPLLAFRQTRDSNRLAVMASTALAPMVGRDPDLGLILDRWQVARQGRGQALLVSGEAGIGKSRLVRAIRERIEGENHAWFELRAGDDHRDTSFYPVVTFLRRSLSLHAENAPEEQVARLEAALELAGLHLAEALPLFARLLALPVPVGSRVLALSSEMQRRRTLELLCEWFVIQSQEQPLVLVVEDLHWTDPSTLALLGMLIVQSPTIPVLIVATHRPSFQSPFGNPLNLTALPLGPLTLKESDVIVESVARGKRVPRAVRELVGTRADGVPLFIEELTKSMLESGLLEETDESWERTDPLPAMAVPDNLKASLEARLARLGRSIEVAQLGAALGREFSHRLIEATSPLDPQLLEAGLSELAASGLLYRRGMPPMATYSFKHALVHETAYQSLATEARKQLHARIAQVLEEGAGTRFAIGPESIGRHYAEAGLIDEAVMAYETAGRRANAQSAHLEATALYRSALELLARLPASADRDLREAGLLVSMCEPMVPSLGSGSPEVEAAYERALSLAKELGANVGLLDALDGLVTFNITQSRLDLAFELAEQQLVIAELLGDPEYRLRPHLSLAIIAYFRGNLRESLSQFERVDHFYDPVAHRLLSTIRGENIGAATRSWSCWAHWMSGYPERAIEAAAEGVARAYAAGHPWTLAFSLAWSCTLHLNCRELAKAGRLAEECVQTTGEQDFPIPLGVARLVRLRCAVAENNQESLQDKGQAIVMEFGDTGTRIAVPQIFGGFASSYLQNGKLDDATSYLESALAFSEQTGQPHWDAELYCIRAEVELAKDANNVDEAEQLYRRALAIAKMQDARMLELRAATRLCELLAETPRGKAAREGLAEIYDWFDEGFALPDLMSAKGTLDRLS